MLQSLTKDGVLLISKQQRQWRKQPGYYLPGSNLQSIITRLAAFITKANHQDPFAAADTLPLWQGLWGQGLPLEKVIHSQQELTSLLTQPQLMRDAVTIMEPWQNVGINPDKQPVRASLNVAYILQRIADIDAILLPAWQNLNKLHSAQVLALLQASLLYVVEGGEPSVYDATTFSHKQCSREELLGVIEQLLLSRLNNAAAGLFICLGHQLVHEAHIRLIKRACHDILHTSVTGISANVLQSLHKLANHITQTAQQLKVLMQDGSCHACGWDDAQFATTANNHPELCGQYLVPYRIPISNYLQFPIELLETYRLTEQQAGVIDVALEYLGKAKVAMFHRDIATQQAAIFANWAYHKISILIRSHKEMLANTQLNWLFDLPCSIKIAASTYQGEKLITANAATCIFYRDIVSDKIRRSFTTQFHPELMDDLRDFSERSLPTYPQLKENMGQSLLARLVLAAITDG